MSVQHEKVLIIGGGNGALAFAAWLGLKGLTVHIWEFPEFQVNLKQLYEKGRLGCEGLVSGDSPVICYRDLGQAMAGASLVLAVVPASVHRRLAVEVGPFLEKNAVLVLNPGRSFGALEVSHILRDRGCMNPVAEAQTLLFACRRNGPCSVRIAGIKETLELGVFPSRQTEDVLQRLTPLIPQVRAAPDVRSTSMGNIGAVFHPAALLLNIGLVESNRDYEFYRDAMTPSVVTIVERVDAERVSAAEASGAKAFTACEWLAHSYGLPMGGLYDMLHANAAYRGILGPHALDSRYITEDVPTGLVPIEAIATAFHVPTPAITSLINLAGCLLKRDFRSQGRNLSLLGLDEIKPADYPDYFNSGSRNGIS